MYFTHTPSGIKVVLPGHGRQQLTPMVASNVLRAIVSAGYDKEQVRAELRGAA